MNNKGNLVLNRGTMQSILISDEVKVTVINPEKASISYQVGDNTTIKHVNDRETNIKLSTGEDISVTVVEHAPKTVKLAIQAPRHISVDREEIRLAKSK